MSQIAGDVDVSLPQRFAALESFVVEWAQKDEATRLQKLQRSSIPELKQFFDAVYPLAEDIKAYLWDKPLDKLSGQDKRLFFILMTFVETAHPIELSWSTTDESASSNVMDIAHISPVSE
jgi:hypothetical protein